MFTGKAVTEQDEYTHPPTPEPHFNESMYFNFFDHLRVCGGFTRIGNRPNEGYAEVTFLYYLPGSQGILFVFDRSPIASNSAFAAGGMQFRVVSPFKELSVSFNGQAFHLPDPMSLEDPKKALSAAQGKAVALALTVRGLSPVFGSAGAEGLSAGEEVEFASAHYEQQTQSTGFIDIGGEKTELNALGLRDHSWGPRHWQAPKFYRWLTAQFGPDLALMLTDFESPSGRKIQSGFVFRGGANIPVKQVSIDTDYAAGGRYQLHLSAAFTTDEGERAVLAGEVLERVPLRNRRKGQTTRICEGFTRYALGDRVGYGISEYLDQE